MTALRIDDDGRGDGRGVDTFDPHAVATDLREAYERGRRDERASRRRHPVFMTFTFLAAAVGLVVLVLAAVNGSFTRAGGVVDETLSAAVSQAQPQAAAAKVPA